MSSSSQPSPTQTAGTPADGGASLATTEAAGPESTQLVSWESLGERYRVLGEIARGGMGIVVRAHDASLDRSLAIKVLLPRRKQEVDYQRRFLEEASITGQLQHPGIPPVHEVGRLKDGRPFFSMKLIEGRTLAELLEKRTSPHADQPLFLKVFEKVAQTLAYAHSRSIIHRDLKPLSIMVGAFGEVQVMDWGLAKRLVRAGATSPPAFASVPSSGAPGDIDKDPDAPSGSSSSQTQAGEVLGTLAYMAPEQARGEIEALDERCDVFGLGGILCAILTRQPPYRGQDRRSLWRQALDAELHEASEGLESCGADGEFSTSPGRRRRRPGNEDQRGPRP